MIFRIAAVFSILSLAAGFAFPATLALPLEINASFPHLHFLADLAALTFFLRRRVAIWIAISSIALLIQTSNIFWPIFSNEPAKLPGGSEFTILYSNVYVHNPSAQKLRSLIEKEQPTLVFLTEVSSQWLESLNIAKDYPYTYLRPGKSADGNAIYSKFPLTDTRRIPESAYFAALFAKVMLSNNKEVSVTLVHAPAPQVDPTGELRFEFFRILAGEIHKNDRGSSILLGDFNTASSNRMLGKILKLFNLRLCSNGWFDFPTWRPFEIPFWIAPIDHMAVGTDIETRAYGAGTDIGSDHLPLLARLRIR